MGKRSDAAETTLLAIELLRRIPPHNRKVTTAQLQQQVAEAGFERDLRTIQRHMDMLSQHFPIHRDDRSRPYGYCWHKDAHAFGLARLTSQDALLLRLAQEHLRNLLPVNLMRSMEGFFEQARRTLHDEAGKGLDAQWAEKVRVVATSQPLLPPRIAPEVFEAVCEALYANLWLHLHYRNASGRILQAEIMPLGMAQQGPRMYLVCRFRGYDDDRLLALHRIQEAEVSTLPFDRPADFDLNRFDAEGRFGFGAGHRIHLQFCITHARGAHLLETPLSVDQQVEEEAGHYRVQATVMETAMLDWWLQAFGDAVWDIQRTPVDALPGG